jgi:Tfp pilus assembly protein PilF
VGKKIVLRKSWVVALGLAALLLMLAIALSLPAVARYYNNRGVQLQRSGDLKAAIENYRRAISLKSGYAEAHYNLADAYEDLPDFDKALNEYQKAIEADPTFYEAYNNLARLYIKQRKDYGAALGLLERALNLKPQEPSVQYSLYKNYGWASLEMQLLGQSEHYLKNAVSLDSGRGAAHCLLAKVFDAQGAKSSALTEWEACAAYSSQPEVEPEWRAQAEERLNNGALTK